MTRPDWDDYFLGVAEPVSARGECTRSKVGCVIVRDRRILATGYNGVAAGQPSCLDGACPRGLLTYAEVPPLADYGSGVGKCIARHAEHNAVLDAQNRGIDLAGATAYITREPCAGCREVLRDAGVTRAVWPGGEFIP